jgi:hypothetical protein
LRQSFKYEIRILTNGFFFSPVIAQTPRVVYYGKVGLELGKLVFSGQKMSPPYVNPIRE